MELNDRVAIVTGASSGIGAATATELARRGSAVTLAARREGRLERVASEVEDADTLVVPTDVTDEEQVTSMIDRAVDAFGSIDILVNNAGVLLPDPVAEAEGDDLRRQVEVNLLGTMHVTRAALAHVREAECGDIVAVSSMNARHPWAHASAYTASKFGVNGFCRSLRKEMGDERVRVTIVMPGPVVTEMQSWTEWDGRPLQPRDVAESIAFAVSRPPHVELGEVIVNSTDKLG